ncbi:MAG: peptidoglycan DD-metalloendopeptidase family protein [Bradyrhizobiaceae bacterium]|nr:peptidoglycan DD-metalloendopeptidase family protein [Bradyrhizobiaceae bacterium]
MYRRDTGFGRQHPHEARHHHRPHASGTRASRILTIGIIGALAAWGGAASLYILFRDDALKLIIEQQVGITRSYQAQASQLQAEIERLRSLKLIDQERVDRALADLVRRQAVIATRQSALSAIGGSKAAVREGSPEITGSLREPQSPSLAKERAPKPTPLSDTILIAAPSERVAQLESRPLPPVSTPHEARRSAPVIENQIAGLARELSLLEIEQSQALNQIEEAYDERERRIRKVFADLGVAPGKPAPRSAEAVRSAAATGGPFLPWTRPAEDPFAMQLHRIRTAALAVEALERDIASVPVRRPTRGPADVTSGFGVRLDPFVRQLAMHTGVDFRAEPGDPVRATAAGKVVQAERNGGYGLMVEVEHANGLTTRYAHLSAIEVAAGSVIPAGAIVGRAGSTGRSTGPHVHYEVRANGEAVDPQRFLRAGLRLTDD